MAKKFSDMAHRLGATLYMPVINPRARAVMVGDDSMGAGSIVICLEDALHDNDVDRGLQELAEMLRLRKELGCAPEQSTLIFVRPRNLEMARRIAAMPGAETLAGLIVPKFTMENGEAWLKDIGRDFSIGLMPTLETGEYFDPGYAADVRQMLVERGRTNVIALRLGGNDLLNTMSLRRPAGLISHEGPLAWVLGMLNSQLLSAGFHVTAPVFDIIHDLQTLQREVERDVMLGFIGKTAIHPSQIPVIHAALRVEHQQAEIASAILAENAAAVFQMHGMMCEPATHRNWARAILNRAQQWGVIGQPLRLVAEDRRAELQPAV